MFIWLRNWFKGQDNKKKKLIMPLLMILILRKREEAWVSFQIENEIQNNHQRNWSLFIINWIKHSQWNRFLFAYKRMIIKISSHQNKLISEMLNKQFMRFSEKEKYYLKKTLVSFKIQAKITHLRMIRNIMNLIKKQKYIVIRIKIL